MSAESEQVGQTQQSVDWEAVYSRMNSDPGKPQSMGQLRGIVFVGVDGVSTQAEAADVINDACDDGELEHTGEGYVVSGYSDGEGPTEEEESTSTSEPVSPEEGVTEPEETVEVSKKELQELNAKVDALERKATRAADVADVALDALGRLAGFDDEDFVIDDLPEAMQEQNEVVTRNSQVVDEVHEQLDELEETSADGQVSTATRVRQLRRYLVEKAEDRGRNFGMDYNAVQTFFDGKGADISDSWASQLLSKAGASEDGTHSEFYHPAFYTAKNRGGNKQIRVDLEKIGSSSVYRLKNSREREDA